MDFQEDGMRIALVAAGMIFALASGVAAQENTAPSTRKPLTNKHVNVEYVGTIEGISPGGKISLSGGEKVYLWATYITDAESVGKLLAGRFTICRQVMVTAQFPVVDCDISPSSGVSDRRFPPYAKLNLFYWLAELGLATNICKERDKLPSDVRAVIHSAGPAYYCDDTRPITLVAE